MKFAMEMNFILDPNGCDVNNPCMNGGTCQFDFVLNMTSCLCPEGFTGDFCEIPPSTYILLL